MRSDENCKYWCPAQYSDRQYFLFTKQVLLLVDTNEQPKTHGAIQKCFCICGQRRPSLFLARTHVRTHARTHTHTEETIIEIALERPQARDTERGDEELSITRHKGDVEQRNTGTQESTWNSQQIKVRYNFGTSLICLRTVRLCPFSMCGSN